MLDVDLEVVLIIGFVRRDLDDPGVFVDSSDLFAWCGPLSILLRATAVPLEVSRLAIVIASNAGPVLVWPEVPLVSVYVYRPPIVPIGCTGWVPLMPVVGLIGRG
jgi:hypothetical protein